MNVQTFDRLLTRMHQGPNEADSELMDAVERAFGVITLDLAADWQNTKAPKWIDEKRDTFTVNWKEEIGDGLGWLNPPPGDIQPWMDKCKLEGERGARFLCVTQAGIDADWFWECLIPYATIFVLSPRMNYEGLPYPLILSAFGMNETAEQRGQIRRWNWKD